MFKTISLPTIGAKLREKLSTSIQHEFQYVVEKEAKNRATQLINQHVTSILSEVVSPKKVEDYLNAQKLINPTTE